MTTFKRGKTKYQRSLKELEERASKFWPEELSQREAKLSILPLLIQTQDKFINLLGLGAKSLEDFFQTFNHIELYPNLFLKHLVVLADFGGEQLKRISSNFEEIFPCDKDKKTCWIKYFWESSKGKRQGTEGEQNEKNLHTYVFQALPARSLSNSALYIDGAHLTQPHTLTPLMKDAIVILLYGSTYQTAASSLSKCHIGDYLGKPKELANFVKQRYIWVSRITNGAKANSLGQLAQQYVKQYIEDQFIDVEVQREGRLPGVSHTDPITNRETSFDLVVTNKKGKNRYVAVEVSFQVTTNSTIERKSGQAKARYEQIEKAGHKIAYVIDGAGNFERKTAVETILSYSHCSVAFSKKELDLLCEFLEETLKLERKV